MNDLKNILIPTDFSVNAAAAYPHAIRLAKAFDAEITVVYVMDVVAYPVGPGQIPIPWQNRESDVASYIDAHFDSVKQAFGDMEVEVVRRDGTPFVELIQYARDAKTDLIVMSTHGHTGFKHLLLGSTAEKVVRKAPCPVLTVHPGERSFLLP